METDEAEPSGLAVATESGLPAEYRSFATLGALQPQQKSTMRTLLRGLLARRCSALDEALAKPDQGDVEQEASRARLLHKVEAGTAAIDAFEKGLYVTIDSEGPTPPLVAGFERIITGVDGVVGGKRANVVVVMPHDRYPGLAATGKYRNELLAEQRRTRIVAFNQLPIDQRRALWAKHLDREKLTDEEHMRLLATFPPGVAWDEVSATLTDRAWRR